MSKFVCLVCEENHNGESSGGLMFCCAKHRNEYFCGDNADVVEYCKVCGELAGVGSDFCSDRCKDLSTLSAEDIFKEE